MELRHVARDELRAAHEARIATWKVAYRGLLPDDYLDSLTLRAEDLERFESRFDHGEGRTFAAWDASGVIGMAVSGACRDEDRVGEEELYALYVLPPHWGTGVAQALWEAALPFTSLWVLESNARARAFYARKGFRPDRTKEVDVGVVLPEIRYVAAVDG